jgi:DNA-binding sugar fermentation-stimulating protein
MNLLLKLDNLIEGKIIKRPSKFIKSPYVADILINNENEIKEQETNILGHCASLGCCGLADNGADVLIQKIDKCIKNSKNKKKAIESKEEHKLKCSYRVYLSIFREKNQEIIIGIYPKLAEELTESALRQKLFPQLQNIKSYKRETSIYIENKVDSRFDFTGVDENNIPFIMEVKNVPLAHYEDITPKERKKKPNNCYDDYNFNSKIAYFPDGFRKKTSDPVSPRALKHIKELTILKQISNTRCFMCYVIERSDVKAFTPSIIDPEYREALKEAIKNGVEIITMCVEWNKDGECRFITSNLELIL